jgi:hypothetical protein
MPAIYSDYVLNLSLSSLRSTQKILHHARLAERGVVARDPMKEAIGLELDMLNIL